MIAGQLLRKYAAFAEGPMIEGYDGICSYTEFLERLKRRESELRKKIPESAVVGLRVTHPFDAFVDLLSLAQLNCLIIPFYESSIPDDRVDDLLDFVVDTDVEARKPEKHNSLLNKFKKRSAPGVVISTSGTTGRPKWLLHDFNFLIEKYLRVRKPFKVPFIYQMDNVSGLETFLSVTAAGGTLLIPANPGPYALNEALSRFSHKPNLISATPSYLRLMMLGDELSSFGEVELINLGGEKLEFQEIERIKQEFPNAELRSFYGTSETSSIRTHTLAGTNYISWGQVGEDFDVIEGQLYLKRKASTMVGYLFDDYDFGEWYPTGDLVKYKERGHYEMVGRLDFRINVGGRKVHPHEVEEIINQFSGVETCSVKGESNSIMGQIVVADIVPNDSFVIAELRKHCALHLEAYKVPQKFNVRDQVELTKRLKKS